MTTEQTTWTFPEPKSLGDAKERRTALNLEKRQVEQALARPNGTVAGRRVRPHEYASWRAETLARLNRLEAESAWLKQWVATYFRDRKRDVLEATAGTDPAAVMQAAREGTINLCRLVNALRAEVEQLRNENTGLRNLLAELRPESVAPSAGHDDWRDE